MKDLGYKGENPKSGNLVINQRGQVALAISNDKYCIKKGYTDTDITIDENVEECEILKEPNPIITTSNDCLTSTICENGTKLSIKVNESENYDFYVINDENNELTLIMSKNLESRVAWITQDDYIAAGGNKLGNIWKC